MCVCVCVREREREGETVISRKLLKEKSRCVREWRQATSEQDVSEF